ncbi:hypothetical protein ATANTOWER_021598 [Ataeniobius toweri]|uniref:Secreted protein n=1 Tax=Ataeniobius toweri TaxID=208326 RepID=A0ABU7A8C1_9TELE|nr:hypothetical protein [Ataeniobius toweri]
MKCLSIFLRFALLSPSLPLFSWWSISSWSTLSTTPRDNVWAHHLQGEPRGTGAKRIGRQMKVETSVARSPNA